MTLNDLLEKLERMKELKAIPHNRITSEEMDELYVLESIELKVIRDYEE